MTKDQLWIVYIKKNPDFLKTGANFTADGLKKFFDQTWDVAFKHGFETNENSKSLFDNIFGKNNQFIKK